MAKQLFTNNASTTIYGTLPQGGTTLVLAAGTGAGFPVPTDGDYFLGTLFEKDPSGNDTRIEIVKCTARTSDSLTIERDFEEIAVAGGFGYPSVAGATVYFELRWTAYAASSALQAGDIGALIEPFVEPGLSTDYRRGDKTWASFFADVREATLSGLSVAVNAAITAADTVLGALGKLQAQITSHVGNTTNPHAVTAAQAGAMATSHAANAITGLGASGASTTVARSDHAHTKTDVGLANVDNTSDATKNAAAATLENKTLANPVVTNYVETRHGPAAGSSFTVDLANGTTQRFTTNANTTIALPASVAGKSYVVEVSFGGAHTVSFTGGGTLRWEGGSAPSPTSVSGKIDRYVFECDGTNTLGSDGGRNF